MESLTPEQQLDYDMAVDLAWEANNAFDERRYAAIAMFTMRDESFRETFKERDANFTITERASYALMPPRAAFETAVPVEPFASETVWALMSKEQKVKADSWRTAMAEQFAEHGVTTDSLRVIMHESKTGENVFTLLHTGNGIDIGDNSKDYDKARSYKAVMAKKNDKLFTVTVDGQKYDTRKGMTDAAYDALYQDAKARPGVTLPDSKKMSEEQSDLWTWTMLTGEDLTAVGRVQVRDVDDGDVRGGITGPDAGRRDLRVRPAVEI